MQARVIPLPQVAEPRDLVEAAAYLKLWLQDWRLQYPERSMMTPAEIMAWCWEPHPIA